MNLMRIKKTTFLIFTFLLALITQERQLCKWAGQAATQRQIINPGCLYATWLGPRAIPNTQLTHKTWA